MAHFNSPGVSPVREWIVDQVTKTIDNLPSEVWYRRVLRAARPGNDYRDVVGVLRRLVEEDAEAAQTLLLEILDLGDQRQGEMFFAHWNEGQEADDEDQGDDE